MERPTASPDSSAWLSIASRSSTPYRKRASRPRARTARQIASTMTGPRRLPTWTVPDGVLPSLTTCGPLTEAASSSAQSIGMPRLLRLVEAAGLATRRSAGRPLADVLDRVREVAGRDVDEDLVALLPSEQGATHRRFVGDPAVRWSGLGGTHDREGLDPVLALDGHGGADLDVVAGVVLVDQGRVLDERLEQLDAALHECLLVLGILVLGVLREVAVLLGVVDPGRDLGPAYVCHVLVLGLELGQAFAREIGGLVHSR